MMSHILVHNVTQADVKCGKHQRGNPMALYQHDAVSVNIGERLRELREARNISMRALATQSGLSANALSMIERGKASPSVSTLYKLAEALGISITSFFGSDTKRQNVVFLKGEGRT